MAASVSVEHPPSQTDPVKQIVFSFYNDQLSKMVVDYDHERTAGMTDADLVDAISSRLRPASETRCADRSRHAREWKKNRAR